MADVPIRDTEITRQEGKFEKLGAEIGRHVDVAQVAYGNAFGQAGDVLRVYLRKYKNEDGSYTIPNELLDHLLVLVREIDKNFRIVSNPSGDLMGENPYKDKAGYGLLGWANLMSEVEK